MKELVTEKTLLVAIAGAIPLVAVAFASAGATEACTFCQLNRAGTQIACDTIAACPSGQVCSGTGGEIGGVPWAVAFCVPAP